MSLYPCYGAGPYSVGFGLRVDVAFRSFSNFFTPQNKLLSVINGSFVQPGFINIAKKNSFFKVYFLRLLYEFSQFSPFFVGAESVFKFTLKRPAAQHYVSYY